MDSDAKGAKPCRTCTDFKTWSSLNRDKINISEGGKQANKEDDKSVLQEAQHRADCPLDKDELGRSGWNFLHTLASAYPEEPTAEEQKKTSDFLKLFAQVYPCDVCAADFQKQIERFPPKTESQTALSQWLCRAHNRINLRIGKPYFDCAKVNERWRDGWQDGSCD